MHSRPMLFFLVVLLSLARALPQLVPGARATVGNVEGLANTTSQTTSVFLVSYTLYTTVTESGDTTSSSLNTQTTTDNGGGSGGLETSVPNTSAQTASTRSDSITAIPSTIASSSLQSVTLVDSITSSTVAITSTLISPTPLPNTDANTDTITNTDTDSSIPIPSFTLLTDQTTSQPPYTYLNTTITSSPTISLSNNNNTTTTTVTPLPTSSLNAQCHLHPTAAICLGPPGNRFYCCNGANPRCNPILQDGGFDCAGKSLGELAVIWIRPTVTLVAQ